MVYPITGPFNSSVDVPRVSRVIKTRYRQKAPYTLPLAYFHFSEKISPATTLGQPCDPTSSSSSTDYPFPLTRAYTYSMLSADVQYAVRTARKKFNDEVRPDTAQLLNLYLERKQSMNMLANRSLQLAAFGLLIRKDPLRAFRYVLPVQRPEWKRVRQVVSGDTYRRFKKGSRSFADLYLEAAFGLLPTISDISSATAVLARGVLPTRVVERGSFSRVLVTGGKPPLTQYNLRYETAHNLKTTVTIGATVSVDNPNLWLANQLGLVNLASTAWEAAPWSFVYDYFLNVSEYLEQFTEHWGLSLSEPYYTVHVRDRSDITYWQTGGPPVTPFIFARYKSEGLRIERVRGALPQITLGIHNPSTLSPRRAATSIALLLQRLPRS